MRALVTGANGLVGANLIRDLIENGHSVRALTRPHSDARSLAGLPIETVHGDVLEPESLVEATRGCDLVFHAAAVFAYWNRSEESLHRLGVQGTRNTIVAAKRSGAGRVVVTSSSVVVGSGTVARARGEEEVFNETDAYARAKAAQEEEAFRCGRENGVEVVAVSPGLCLGAHDYRLSPSNGIVCSYLADPWKLTWPGGCNLVSVRDVARGHVLAGEQGVAGSRYLLTGDNLEWADVHRTVAELCGVSEPRFTANHTSAYLAAAAQEWLARWTKRSPLTTRAQARMVGRYYWYRHDRAASLGYAPRPCKAALAEAIAWLVTTEHVPMSLRATLRLAPEVYAAWEAIQTREVSLRKSRLARSP